MTQTPKTCDTFEGALILRSSCQELKEAYKDIRPTARTKALALVQTLRPLTFRNLRPSMDTFCGSGSVTMILPAQANRDRFLWPHRENYYAAGYIGFLFEGSGLCSSLLLASPLKASPLVSLRLEAQFLRPAAASRAQSRG